MDVRNVTLIIFHLIILRFSLALPSNQEHANIFIEHYGFSSGNNKELRLAAKNISSIVDDINKIPFGDVSKKFGVEGHRNWGHWGFSGSIPFERNEYLQNLIKEGVTKQEIVSAWRNQVDAMTDEVIKYTGLPRKQAKAFAGLIYSDHILMDYLDSKTSALQDIKYIHDDIIKNTSAIFGKESVQAKNIENGLRKIPKKFVTKENIVRSTIKTIEKENLGEKMGEIYSKNFQDHKIKLATKELVKKNEPQQKSFSKKEVARNAAFVAGFISTVGNGWKVYNEEREIEEAIINVAEDTGTTYAAVYVSEGIIEKVGEKYVVTALTKDGVNISTKLIGTSLNYGLATFIFDETRTIYYLSKGKISLNEFTEDTVKAGVRAAITGGAATCAVALGIVPGGAVVTAISIGGYIVADAGIKKYESALAQSYFDIEHVLGSVSKELLNRKGLGYISNNSFGIDYTPSNTSGIDYIPNNSPGIDYIPGKR
ncbi:hypothetical protein [uncultured Ilyobacter sp.]|uniref:hypothetical protein n=1 Tax=uncultured Ilyobacter sp. TaxID=544433 RepID=UPI0029BFF584|nr:hypothetical protein [uncultured Ilyobacter sp.]